MAYLVLARKYRPKNFESVVHQEHVTTTLKNAIDMDRVAHAHIFTGPRGTGKTTIARILAKAMNCADGPTPKPCEECRSCKEISNSNPSDVIEIDGASNNSVDQIREIRDNLQYKPSHSKFKIYIIDEVHMLSTAAFNALLKSLEEPPQHIMFLFATTEPHKVPVTIMSRCQRHDLKMVPVNILTNHLMNLCSKEGIAADENGVINIAVAAEGSVRDSMSILDQVISSSPEKEISQDHINWVLGSTPFPIIKESITALLSGNAGDLIKNTSKLYFSGADLKIFYKKIIEYLRHLIIIKIDGENGELCDLPENQKKDLMEIGSPYSIHHLTSLLDIFLKEEVKVRQSDNIRILLELIFIKITQIPKTEDLLSLIQRLDELEVGNIKIPENYHISSAPAEKPIETVEEKKIEPIEVLPQNTEKKVIIEEPFQESTIVAATPEPTMEPVIPQPDPQEETPEKDLEPVKEKAVEESEKPAFDTASMADYEKWNLCVKTLRKETPSLGEILETRTEFESFTNGEILISVHGTKFHISKLKNRKYKEIIEKSASEIFGTAVSINLLDSEIESPGIAEAISDKEKIIAELKVNPLVMAIKDKLKARVIDERILEVSETAKDEENLNQDTDDEENLKEE